jgi:hypothetical protein
MTDSTLSPAAQAVLDAAFPTYDDENLYFATGEQHAGKIAAAALRAAADHCHAQEIREADHTTRRWICIDELLAIAAELEDGNG